MIDVDDVRGLCADLADNSTGRSGAYELELRCRAARLLPAMLDEVERLRAALAEAVELAGEAIAQHGTRRAQGGAMIETQHTIAAWADATFGPAVSLTSIAERAMVELRELVEKCRALDEAIAGDGEFAGNGEYDPRHATEEAADVVIVLSRLFVELGVDMHAAIDRKMQINRARRWTLDGNGHGQHVEDDDAK